MAIRMPGRSAAAGEGRQEFDAPLEALAQRHGELQSQCVTLARLAAHVAAGGADDDTRATARRLRRQFEEAMADTHQDEEQALFPALLESMAGSDAVCIRQMCDSRAAEHRELEMRWLALGQWLQAIENGQTARPGPGAVDAFVSLCRRHLEQEDGELLPMAERLLSDDALSEIADDMRRRHGRG
jgi:hemerythrin-like domain-containing protein